MSRRKLYGSYRIETCPFCDKRALMKNKQGIPVCKDHKDETLPDLKCVCGSWLDIVHGKWGPFFTCISCGNISFWKALEMNPDIKKN